MPRALGAVSAPVSLKDRALFGLIARFGLYATLLLGLVATLNAKTHYVADLMAVTASAATALIGASGVPASHAGMVISVPGRQLVIASECTGVSVAAVFVALVVAYPVRISSRIVGALVGVLAIFAANLARLVAVAHMADVSERTFTFAHDFLFQAGMVAVAIATWVGWLSCVRARPDSGARARSRFVLLFVVASVAVYGVFAQLEQVRSEVWRLGYVPVVIAAMLSAQGALPRRKLTYAAVTAALPAVLYGIAIILGVMPSGDATAMVRASHFVRIASATTWEVLFLAVPFALLAVFVGRRPSILWTARRPADR